MFQYLSESQGSTTTRVPGIRRCLCNYADEMIPARDDQDASSLKCPACVKNALQPHIERHQQALRDREQARENCARHLQQIPSISRLSDLQAQSQALRDRLATLRTECADMGIRVASQAVENDSHREMALPSVDLPQIHLARLEATLLSEALAPSIALATTQVKNLRFHWARKALQMYRLDIHSEDIKLTPMQKRRQGAQPKQPLTRRARGIGKIGGLPLPHAGPELYGVLPPRELQSALRLVAAVTSTVARCLGILLPHPILLTPTGPSGDITEMVPELEWHRQRQVQKSKQQDEERQSRQSPGTATSNSSSFMSTIVDTSYWKKKAKSAAKKAVARATGQPIPTSSSSKKTTTATTATHSSFASPSMDSIHVTQRIHHATAAVLAEDQRHNSSTFSLSSDHMANEGFAIALQFLQNDVIVLCIRAGVPVAKLWPAEAMLLNLHALDNYCIQQTAANF